MPTLVDWIQAARPKKLGAAVAPVVVGSVLGWRLGVRAFDWALRIVAMPPGPSYNRLLALSGMQLLMFAGFVVVGNRSADVASQV